MPYKRAEIETEAVFFRIPAEDADTGFDGKTGGTGSSGIHDKGTFAELQALQVAMSCQDDLHHVFFKKFQQLPGTGFLVGREQVSMSNTNRSERHFNNQVFRQIEGFIIAISSHCVNRSNSLQAVQDLVTDHITG